MPSLRIQLSALAAAVLGAAAVQAAPSHGGVAAVSSASQTGSGEGDVKIGIMDTISTGVDTASLREGLVLLSNPLEKDFRISWRDIVTPDAAQEVLHQKPDFLMLPTEQIDLMEEQGVQTFRIATRKPWTATDAAHAVGSLVVTRADRTDINTLEDLAGRHIAADTPTSLTGWLALQGEIARAGHDPERRASRQRRRGRAAHVPARASRLAWTRQRRRPQGHRREEVGRHRLPSLDGALSRHQPRGLPLDARAPRQPHDGLAPHERRGRELRVVGHGGNVGLARTLQAS
ncbi:MAG: PhnD/SsuA/transferrin family substrate-binding protein [Sutterella wadsworthensis]|nr:PhnD/SsuA/transferrin family substrate-binding protein [Sutterella wadsworthensis]